MNITRPLVLAVCVASAVTLSPAVETSAVTHIDTATSGHVESLVSLLEKVPRQARAGIGRALEAAREGRDKAIRTLGLDLEPRDWESSRLPAARQLFQLRSTVAASFRRSLAEIRKLDPRLTAEVTAGVEEARISLERYRKEALRSLAELLTDSTDGRKGLRVPNGGGDRPDSKNARSGRFVGSPCHPIPPSAFKPTSAAMP
jgi:hypothetical protein